MGGRRGSKSSPGPGGTFGWQVGKYVVRDEDLDVFDALTSAAPAAIAALTAAPPDAHKELISAAVAAGVAAFKMLRSVIRNYTELTNDERALIAALKMRGGSMADQLLVHTLVDTLPTIFPSGDAVRQCLKRLERKTLRSGDVKPLITIDGRGLWSSVV